MKNIPSLPLAICLTILLVLPAARAGTAESNIITVDTRQLKLSSLVVSGPSSLALGSEAPYTATLNLEGGQVRDVTSECQWTVTGGPKVENFWEMPAMNGNVLDARVASATPLKVAASFLASTGRIASTPIAVTVTESNGMNIGLGFRSPSTSKPHYIGFSGGQHGWRVVVEASGLAALKAGVTFRWFLDGVQVGTGKTLDYEIVGQAGERQLSVVATDLQGRTGQTFASLVCDCPPGAGEPDTGISAQDPGVGEVLDENGQWFAFDASKKANGLIVLTHGLKGGGIDDWLQAMAKAIRLRLEASGKVPNIVIYGWGAKSDPTTAIGYDAMLNRARAMATNFVQEYTILGTDMALNMLLQPCHRFY